MLAAATAVAAIARRVSLPESVVLVVVGLFGAVLFPEIRFAVTPALVLGVFIPGLVFAAEGASYERKNVMWVHLARKRSY